MPKKHIKLENIDVLNETNFEELCFELLGELGFINIDWRKGTALSSSPADRGRDIVAQLERTDIDGTKHLETWFVDCKHYKRGVPPERLQSLLSWANAERPDVALVTASGFLSNPAKDYIRDYELNNKPPFRIKYWERPTLERIATGYEELIRRYLLDVPRTESDIMAAEQEFFDKVWYVRSIVGHNEEDPTLPDDIRKIMLAARKRIEQKYGKSTLNKMIGGGHDKAWEYGFASGKLSALRWVLGEEWDFLDT
jgi:hypothetical protein